MSELAPPSRWIVVVPGVLVVVCVIGGTMLWLGGPPPNWISDVYEAAFVCSFAASALTWVAARQTWRARRLRAIETALTTIACVWLSIAAIAVHVWFASAVAVALGFVE